MNKLILTPCYRYPMNTKLFLLSILVISLIIQCSMEEPVDQSGQKVIEADVCVYTANASGIMAALAVKAEGKSVVVVEPSQWVGGILGAGIKPIQDCPNFDAVGGNTKKIMGFLGTGQRNPLPEDSLRKLMRRTSPKQIREDFLQILKENNIEVIYNHRVSLVNKTNNEIQEAIFDFAPVDSTGSPSPQPKIKSALRVISKVYIDAGYEGDLMAMSAVSYRVGRESTYDYNEQSAGVGPPTNVTPLDPFVIKGDKSSGILPLINDEYEQKEGIGDYYTQAYNFRFYTTNDPQYRAEFSVPIDYDPLNYELVGRYVEYLKSEFKDPQGLEVRLSRIFPGWMNAGEYNYHRASLITMAPVGISHLYADGDYGVKSKIWKAHQDYLSGLKHFMSTDSRVPEDFRNKTSQLGLDLRHHPETNGWPHQLYARIARRLIGNYTITSHDVYNETVIDDPIALAQYGIDTYPSRRVWFEKDGETYVSLEGNMFVGGANGPTNVPYPIAYRAITPKSNECTNLLVPVCFSATHLGYASARMEPVFMMCGESAGIAAAQAIDESVWVQNINSATYKKKLMAKGQIISW